MCIGRSVFSRSDGCCPGKKRVMPVWVALKPRMITMSKNKMEHRLQKYHIPLSRSSTVAS